MRIQLLILGLSFAFTWARVYEPCSTNAQCDVSNTEVCHKGTCQCLGNDPRTMTVVYTPNPVKGQYYDERTCRATAGSRCSLDGLKQGKCLPASICGDLNGEMRCLCEGNLVDDATGQCAQNFGSKCDSSFVGTPSPIDISKRCASGRGFDCISGTCQCLRPAMKFDSTRNLCLPKLSERCDAVLEDQCFDKNAACRRSKDGFLQFLCQCKPGFVEKKTANGETKCVKKA